jgi:hypothetical protein
MTTTATTAKSIPEPALFDGAQFSGGVFARPHHRIAQIPAPRNDWWQLEATGIAGLLVEAGRERRVGAVWLGWGGGCCLTLITTGLRAS